VSDDAPTPSPPQPSTNADTVVLPLIIWLLIQLAAIALAASGVRLAAHFPQPPRSLAVHYMLVAQFVGSAVFLPVLFRGWRSWLAIVLAAGPMVMLAAALARTPIGRVMGSWSEVAAWATMLAACRAILPRRLDVLTALAVFLSAGGLLMRYLQLEFRPTAMGWLFPLVVALRFDPPLASTFVPAATSLVILAVIRSFRRKGDQSAAAMR
jgi:hypothetical protein